MFKIFTKVSLPDPNATGPYLGNEFRTTMIQLESKETYFPNWQHDCFEKYKQEMHVMLADNVDQ